MITGYFVVALRLNYVTAKGKPLSIVSFGTHIFKLFKIHIFTVRIYLYKQITPLFLGNEGHKNHITHGASLPEFKILQMTLNIEYIE